MLTRVISYHMYVHAQEQERLTDWAAMDRQSQSQPEEEGEERGSGEWTVEAVRQQVCVRVCV